MARPNQDFERPQGATLLARLRKTPSHLITLSGPRQSGKTTLVRQVLPRLRRPYWYIPVDRPDSAAIAGDLRRRSNKSLLGSEASMLGVDKRDSRWLVRTWEEARRAAWASKRGFVLALDEIQLIPNWSQTVKGLWDDDWWHKTPLHVILLGSAPLLMQRGLKESLAGRHEELRLPHWSFAEMATAFKFNLDQFIFFGGYPGAAAFFNDVPRWRSYVIASIIRPIIERDILGLQRIEKPALLKRLIELACEYSGQILSYTKMVGQLQEAGNTTTLARYLDLLQTVGFVSGLSAYSKQQHQRRLTTPKLCVQNTALLSYYANYTYDQARADRTFWGHLVESAVGAHLINSRREDYSIFYWRNKHWEVDYVLQQGQQLIAMEVKSGRRLRDKRGLEAFMGGFPNASTKIIGGPGIPLAEFFLSSPNDWFKKT